MSVRCLGFFPEALDPCFAFCALSHSSPCNAYHRVVAGPCCLIAIFMHVIVTSSLSSCVVSWSCCRSTLVPPRHHLRRCCHPRVSSLCVLVVSFLCCGLLILCLSRLSCRCPCPSCVIVLCVSKVGTHRGASLLLVSICGCWPSFVFVFRCSSLSGVALVVVVAHDMVLPRRHWLFHCWLCAMVVGGQWQQ